MAKSRKRRERRYRASMPLLPRRLPRPRVEIDRGLMWLVIWAAPRAEARIQARLLGLGLGAYVPTEVVERVRRGKRIEQERPAISRYVFVGLNAAQPEFWQVDGALSEWGGLQTQGRVLRTADNTPLRVPASALQRLADGLTVFDEPVPALRPGDRANVRTGPFEGLLAEIETADDVRVRALVNLFGGTVRAEFEPGQLEAA